MLQSTLLNNFVLMQTDSSTGVLTESYNPQLVLASIFVAIVASYSALTVAIEMVNARLSERKLLLGGGAIAMGMGIWSMHFIGMIALSLPVETGYNVFWTVISMLPAIGASALAFYLMTSARITSLTLLLSATVMGTGIAIMHYLGMAAMEIRGTISYKPLLFILSILVAIVVSLVAILIFSRIRQKTLSPKMIVRMIIATVMGLGITAMHYTGMAATIFRADSSQEMEIGALNDTILGAGVIISTLLILGSTILLAGDRKSIV